MTLLELTDISVRYPRTDQDAVSNVNLRISAGEAIGVVGESGSGKTTVARVLAGIVSPTQGEATIAGRPWNTVSSRDPLRRQVQLVFQDPFTALNPYLSARDTVAEVFQVWHGLRRRQARDAATSLLESVGLSPNVVDRRPTRLSGGQCQRVGIARALACDPAVLIADEPTSALDVSVQAQILNLLVRLRAERNLALVLVSHDLPVIRHATETAYVMHQGHVVEQGLTEQLLSAPEHPYTQLLLDSYHGIDREELASSGQAVGQP